MENKFMRVEEVAEVLEVSTSFAYKVIRQLNDELKAKDMEQQRKQNQRTRRRNTNYER